MRPRDSCPVLLGSVPTGLADLMLAKCVLGQPVGTPRRDKPLVRVRFITKSRIRHPHCTFPSCEFRVRSRAALDVARSLPRTNESTNIICTIICHKARRCSHMGTKCNVHGCSIMQ